MKKLYVDAILESKETMPDPGNNQTLLNWVKPLDYSMTKTSPQYSMGIKLESSRRSLIKTQQGTPGPGDYGLTEGSAQSLRKSSNNITDRMKNMTGDLSTRQNTLEDQSLCLKEDSILSKNFANRNRQSTSMQPSKNTTM